LRTKHSIFNLLGVLLFGMAGGGQPAPSVHQPNPLRQSASIVVAAPGENTVYLPIIVSQSDAPRVNVPYFGVADIFRDRFDEMAIFWLGRVTPTENYADVRIGYSDTSIEVRLGIFDRLLWFDTSPSPGDLEAWDAVTLYLDLDGTSASAPAASAYRFVSQLSWDGRNRGISQTAYRGNGTGWVSATVPFTTAASWRGNAPLDNIEDRGWVPTFKIPFASLGLSGPPSQGTLWGFGVAVHDRDESAGTAIADQLWPETLNPNQPARWGELRFGPPAYTAPPATITQTVVIREGLAGADVPDTTVGRVLEKQCPGSANYIWTVWGNTNSSSSIGSNIQNQGDIADWPCYAKYYVKFPLSGIPRAGNIISATLTLYHWGNSGDPLPGQPNSASPSFIHVLTVPSGWTEDTLTWNNDPQPLENVSQAWVPVMPGCTWPCAPRNWDVSYAVAKAYAAGGPISFALYSSDRAYHSGKYFSTSDLLSQNGVGRPTLTVVWGEP
jgi:hypothetical protein